MREIHWAVLGTGVIANEMATALEKNGKNYLFHGADEELAAYLEDIRLGRRE